MSLGLARGHDSFDQHPCTTGDSGSQVMHDDSRRFDPAASVLPASAPPGPALTPDAAADALNAIGCEAAELSLQSALCLEAMQGLPNIRHSRLKSWGFESRAAGAPGIHLQRQLRWRPLPASVRWPVWPAVVAALAILGLLLAIQQVVRGAVQRGDMRRQAVAVQAESTWRCKALSGLLLRASCLSQLNAAQTDPAMRGAEGVDSAAAVARAGF